MGILCIRPYIPYSLLVILCMLLTFFIPTANAKSFHYSNPLPFSYETYGNSHKEIRDPVIINDGDTYYLVFTMWPFSGREENRTDLPDQGGSPGIGLYRSKDLMSWTFDRWLVKSSDLPENCPYKNRFWAPEIHKFGSKYYLIFTADNWIKKEYNPAGSWGSAGYAFVGVADKITGPYKHITYIDGGACDTTLFQDTDGKTYAFIPRYNIDVQQIDLSGLDHGVVHMIGKPKMIVQPNNSDIGIKASPSYLEGPWTEKINGKYYLFFAEIYNDPKYPEMMGYRTGVAYADNPLGPWKKDPRGYVFYGGHLGIFTGPDGRKWFSYRIEKDNTARGLLAVDPFDIDSGGKVQAEKPTIGPQTIPLKSMK